MSDVSPVDQGKRTLMGIGTLAIGAIIGGPMAFTAFQFAVGNAIKKGGGEVGASCGVTPQPTRPAASPPRGRVASCPAVDSPGPRAQAASV